MNIVIAFYRIRDVDDAHAIVGRESAEAADLDEAIEIALELLRTLDMPQRPDAMTITDGDGSTIHSSRLDTIESLDERPTP
ncbi:MULTISPECIES: hypothetical protein [Sinorhizobium]|uniref:Uncharacterized protein n=1 Tax=Rhizobium fredii TaxID=380 RepID=A0A2L0H7Z4_RHIFR|nr:MULTISPECIES: hypothetical protein [Sinorhizobium]AUX77616.1 hypothetical protein NXT3_CH03064 [Sinorhizobium fredii]PDT49079.1 hypothetical protein CO664_28265 [Sinorhizobium sp. NG07B]POH33195.1 hypothetical protein ATY30_03365 [Sinorhizobium americanum]